MNTSKAQQDIVNKISKEDFRYKDVQRLEIEGKILPEVKALFLDYGLRIVVYRNVLKRYAACKKELAILQLEHINLMEDYDELAKKYETHIQKRTKSRKLKT